MLLWQVMFPPPEPPGGAPEQLEEEVAPAGQEAAPPAARPQPPAAGGETVPLEPRAETPPAVEISAALEATEVVETATFRAELSNRGAQLVAFELLEHRSAAGGPVDLVRAREGLAFPFGLVDAAGTPSPLNDALFVAERSRDSDSSQRVAFEYSGPMGRARKIFRFRPDGLFDVEVEADQRGWGVFLGPGVRNPSPEELANRFARKSAGYLNGEGMTRIDPLKATGPERVSGAVRWVGLQDTYFLAAVIPEEPFAEITVLPFLAEPAAVPAEAARFVPAPPKDQLTDAQEEMVRELGLVVRPAGERLVAQAFWGAKQYNRLAALPHSLEESVNLGFFSFLAKPLLWGLQWIHNSMVRNYGWAIILMTILIRILLFPLMHKSVVSMQKMQELNPKMQAIRQKYRSKLKDRQGRPNAEAQRKMNEEIMGLYKKEGVNPAGGCLPMLLQIPVLFAFYSLLSAAIELRHAPWMLWIQDLSAPDPFYALPIIMGASQFVQQRMTPTAADPMQRRIFMMMPIFFTVLFLGFPAGLVLYWLTNNLLGILQQWAYKRLKEKKEAAAA